MFEQNIKKPVRASDEVIQAIANKEKKATQKLGNLFEKAMNGDQDKQSVEVEAQPRRSSRLIKFNPFEENIRKMKEEEELQKNKIMRRKTVHHTRTRSDIVEINALNKI